MTDILKSAEQALVKLGGKSPGQAAELVQQLTPAEQLAAHSCQQEGDKIRLIDLLDHVATRQHIEADLAAFQSRTAEPAPADPEDPTDS